MPDRRSALRQASRAAGRVKLRPLWNAGHRTGSKRIGFNPNSEMEMAAVPRCDLRCRAAQSGAQARAVQTLARCLVRPGQREEFWTACDLSPLFPAHIPPDPPPKSRARVRQLRVSVSTGRDEARRSGLIVCPLTHNRGAASSDTPATRRHRPGRSCRRSGTAAISSCSFRAGRPPASKDIAPRECKTRAGSGRSRR